MPAPTSWSGTGRTMCLPVEVYKGKPIFYSLCNLSFHSGHRWCGTATGSGILGSVALEGGKRWSGATIEFMRHNEKNETFVTPLGKEAEALAEIVAGSAAFGTQLKPNGEHVEIALAR